MNKYSIRTDLASELKEEHQLNETSGVKEEKEEINGVKISRVEILSESASEKLGKDIGKYITISFDGAFTDDNYSEIVVEIIKQELQGFANFKDKDILVIGLGNAELTADALGPKTISKIIPTRHLKKHMAELFNSMNLGNVASLSTGVLGKTGIESFELVKATIEEIKPSLIIIIDALAAREMKRLCSTLQISNTGIKPGSGVGNNREELSEKTLGVPVISMGIPTVVDAVTLAYDALSHINKNCAESEQIIEQALTPYDLNLIVTPKDIDVLMKKCACLLSYAINKTLHNNLTKEEINLLSD